MIVAMEKITLLIHHKAKDAFLSRLQSLGVVHIDLKQAQVSADRLKKMEERIGLCRRFLKEAPKFQGEAKENPGEEIFEVVESARRLRDEIFKLDQEIEKLDGELKNLEPWGDFDRGHIERLEDAGVKVRFFTAPIKKFDALSQREFPHAVITRDRTYIYFVVFDAGKDFKVDCDEFYYPKLGRAALGNRRLTLEGTRRDKAQVLRKLYSRAQEVAGHLHFLISRSAFLNVRDRLDPAVEETVFILRGWIPAEKRQALSLDLANESAYFYFEQPAKGEQPPILLRNNKFASLFEPITKMFDLPNYAELDLTCLFAPFFILFFGLCLGDAGYGLVIFAAATVARFKVTPEKRPLTMLLQILGGATFFCGLIVGTVFGYDLSKIAGLKKIVLFDQDSLFNFALILGLVQVLFGMCVKSYKLMRQTGFLAGLAPLGWVILMIGLLGLMKFKASIYAVYLGIGLILFFNDTKASIPLRIGKGLWELYGITGVFGDILSYIRLFALGISSAILGLVVNDSAAQMWHIPYAGFILAPLFFLASHALNLALSALSSFVHPLRLTFVEFYKNAGFEGGGRAYRPFSRV